MIDHIEMVPVINGEPPHDGSWWIQIAEDGSGVCLWAWYLDENGNEGWHEPDGAFDGNTPFPSDTVLVRAPAGFVGWIETHDVMGNPISESESIRAV